MTVGELKEIIKNLDETLPVLRVYDKEDIDSNMVFIDVELAEYMTFGSEGEEDIPALVLFSHDDFMDTDDKE